MSAVTLSHRIIYLHIDLPHRILSNGVTIENFLLVVIYMMTLSCAWIHEK